MLEKCVDIVPFGAREIVTIKEPGTVRSPQGLPVYKITCTFEELPELIDQLQRALWIHEYDKSQG